MDSSQGNVFINDGGKYAEYRPTYPEELYKIIFANVKVFGTAWDVGCGSGQASARLAQQFQRVIATDPSNDQIKNAVKAGNIEYRVEPAETSSLRNKEVSLITVAEALHWFNIKQFLKEAERVLIDGGILATWCYWLRPETTNEQLNEALKNYDRKVVGPYWRTEVLTVQRLYSDLQLPFEVINCPEIYMQQRWSLHQLLSYMDTWSAAKIFFSKNSQRPSEVVKDHFLAIWGEPESPLELRWKLGVKISRK